MWDFNKRISLFVCLFVYDFVFHQQGRPNLCFLNLKGWIARQKLVDRFYAKSFAFSDVDNDEIYLAHIHMQSVFFEFL